MLSDATLATRAALLRAAADSLAELHALPLSARARQMDYLTSRIAEASVIPPPVYQMVDDLPGGTLQELLERHATASCASSVA